MQIWVGTDWDQEKCVVFFDVDGATEKGKVMRHPEAVCDFVRQRGEGVVVGIEAGDPGWVSLWEQAGATVFVFDPKKAKRYAESLCSSGASDDSRSAEYLREMVQSEKHREHANRPLPVEVRSVDRMLSALNLSSKEVDRHCNRVRDLLRQIHPALFAQLGELDSLSTIGLLQAAPTPLTWSELSTQEQEKAFGRMQQKTRKKLRAVLGEVWIQFEPAEDLAARVQLRQLLSHLETAVRERLIVQKELDKSVSEDRIASRLSSITGLGRFLSAGSAIALHGHGDSRDGAACRLGIAPVTIRSGTKGDKHPTVRIRRNTPNRMRKVGYLVAVQLVKRHRWAKAQKQYYLSRGIDNPGAFRRVSRSFLRIATALARTGEEYDEERYIRALKAKGVPWAINL